MAVGDNLTVVGLSAIFPNTRIIVLSLKRDLVVMRRLDLGVVVSLLGACPRYHVGDGF